MESIAVLEEKPKSKFVTAFELISDSLSRRTMRKRIAELFDPQKEPIVPILQGGVTINRYKEALDVVIARVLSYEDEVVTAVYASWHWQDETPFYLRATETHYFEGGVALERIFDTQVPELCTMQIRDINSALGFAKGHLKPVDKPDISTLDY